MSQCIYQIFDCKFLFIYLINLKFTKQIKIPKQSLNADDLAKLGTNMWQKLVYLLISLSIVIKTSQLEMIHFYGLISIFVSILAL